MDKFLGPKTCSLPHSETIQDFGFLFVLDKEKFVIEQVSENLSDFLDFDPQEVLGQNFFEVIGTKYEHSPLPSLDEEKSILLVECSHKKTAQKMTFEFLTIQDGALLFLEVLPVKDDVHASQMMRHLSLGIERIEKSRCLNELSQRVVEETQKMTGFDRVMVFQFDEDGCGTVVAEKRSDDKMQSYLGNHFPSSDIPQSTRKILRESLVRMIPNSSSRLVALKPSLHPRMGCPTDLTKTLLHSPSALHTKYLQNIGVGSALTVAIMKDDDLWGLISCHHLTEKTISQTDRFSFRILGKVVSSLITTKVNFEDYQYSQKVMDIFEKIHINMESSDKILDALLLKKPSLLDLNPVEGSAFVMCYEGRWKTVGETPGKKDISRLIQWIRKNKSSEVFYTDSIQRLYPESAPFLGRYAGIMIIDFPYGQNNFILWLRPEKSLENNKERNKQTGLSALASFDAWKEEVQFRSIPWKSSEVEAAKKIKRAIIEFELMRQYREFQILADSVDNYIWVSSPDGTPEYYNKRWMEVTGLSNDFEVAENRGGATIHPDDMPKARENWEKCIKEGIPFTSEMRIKTKQGTYQWILARTVPAKNEKGAIVKWYGSGINIDQIKKIEADLKEALSVRDEFISLASHELKTPITSLGLLLELSQRTLQKSSQISPYIERSFKELKRLRFLVDDLLDVSKISSGKMEFQFRQNDLSKIVSEVLERYQYEPLLKHLVPKFENFPSLIIECDEFRIEQLLTNLISNALKYGNNRPVDIELIDQKNSVTLKVKDQGIGISPADQGRIFDRFERVGHNSGISGLGLGLYICKNIVDAHHGVIKVQSDLGKGTVFEVMLKKKL